MKHYPRHIGDYLRDTGHLTLLEHGVYTRLLDMYYDGGGPLKLDVETLARRLTARTAEERAALTTILAEFFVLVDGAWTNKRCEATLSKYREFGEVQRRRVSKRYAKPTEHIPENAGGYQANLPAVEETLPAVYQSESTNHKPETINHIIPPTPFAGGGAADAAPKVRKKKSSWGDPLDGLPEILNVPEFTTVWLEFVEYRKKQTNKTLPSRSRVFAKAVSVGIPAAVAGMIESMEKGWSGIHITKNAKLEKRSGECPESLSLPTF